jgi:trigger factor
MPTVEIADYKKFNIKLDSEEVTDEETQHEFDRMIKKDIMLTNKETGTVENGDSVNIDFTGYIDDKEFAGGSAKGYDLVIGSNSFIPGFESQLIGCTIGETKDIFLTFPKNYHEQYANKEVKFTVKINSISTITKPTFDEFYFKKFKLSDVKTEKDFKEYLKKQLVD